MYRVSLYILPHSFYNMDSLPVIRAIPFSNNLLIVCRFLRRLFLILFIFEQVVVEVVVEIIIKIIQIIRLHMTIYRICDSRYRRNRTDNCKHP